MKFYLKVEVYIGDVSYFYDIQARYPSFPQTRMSKIVGEHKKSVTHKTNFNYDLEIYKRTNIKNIKEI